MTAHKGFLRRGLASGARTLARVFWPLFWFELVLHMVRTVLVRPFLGRVLQMLLEASGYRLAFNENIRDFFLTPVGLLAALILLAGAALFIYFEFSVIILVAYHRYGGEKVRVRQAGKEALTGYHSLGGLGFFGFCAYTMLLLPVTGVGLSSSLVPDFDIPNFITGEVLKNWYGVPLLVVAGVLALLLVRGMLFVLPVMTLEGKRFFGAVARSWKMQSKTKARVIALLALFFLAGVLLVLGVAVAEVLLLGDLPEVYAWDDLLLNSDAIWRFLVGLGILLLVQLFQVVATPLLLTFLVALYMELDPHVRLNYTGLAKIDRRIIKINGRLGKHPRAVRRVLWLVCLVLLAVGMVQMTYTGAPSAGRWYVIGHRGSAYGVENTLPAVQGAMDAGADYAEIDILLSKDSVPMVVHDANLKRLADRNVEVADLTAAQLQALTLAEDGYTGHIPTLEELLAFCDGKQKLLIEFKRHGRETQSVVANTLQVVARCGFAEQAIYHTLIYSCLQEAKLLDPEAQVGYIVYGTIGDLSAQNLRALGSDFIVVEESMASDRLMGEASIAGMPVFVWTVNDADAMQDYYTMGATGIITDYPDVGMAQLKEVQNWFAFWDGVEAQVDG